MLPGYFLKTFYLQYFALFVIIPRISVKLYLETATSVLLGKMKKKKKTVTTFWRYDLCEQIEHVTANCWQHAVGLLL